MKETWLRLASKAITDCLTNMGKFAGRRDDQRKPRLGPGISLQKFAGAKTNRYDKRAKAEKLAALNAKKINKYRKLKARLEKEGRLQPILPTSTQVEEEEEQGVDIRRALSRAGPAPGEEDSTGRDSVGTATPPESPHKDQAVEQAVSSGAAPIASASQKPECASPGIVTGGPQEGTQQEGNLKSKRKKRAKPLAQVQRVAEKVQAEKELKDSAKQKAREETKERQKQIAEAEKQRKQQTKLFLKKTRRGQPVMKHRLDKILSQLQQDLQ